MRTNGILMPVFSLPSAYGIGDMGPEAYRFVDFLDKAGQSFWQILPLNPTNYGDYPYQSFSTFAGHPYFVSPDLLIEDGLLTEDEVDSFDFGDDPEHVNYGKLYNNRLPMLKIAFSRFEGGEDYERFVTENNEWLDGYALFMTIKNLHQDKGWTDWEDDYRFRKPEAIERVRCEHADLIDLYKFIQYEFDLQWKALKAYANEKMIRIIGDVPIYVAYDSADVWCSPELFALDENKKPIEVAGCPPDPFSPTGQLWGNPLYDWDYHRETGYKWWISRLQYAAKLYDVLRIDHFRGFESYYTIPFGNTDAVKGKWRKGPNKALFQTAKKALGELNIIAEDLGFITPGVRKMLDALGYPGMKVLQFGFDSDPDNEHLPHNFKTPHCIAYTGTHDNQTLRGWVETADKKTIKYAKSYLRCKKSQIPDEMVAACWQSIAEIAVAQMQDFLHAPASGRMNTPSVLGGNWMYRTSSDQFTPELAKEIRKLNRTYGRAVKPTEPEKVTQPEPKPEEKQSKPKRSYRRRKQIEPPAQPAGVNADAAPAKSKRPYARRKKTETKEEA